ncbi:MAG: chaperone modulator CbpM [Hyphomonadaceae bacterium]
MTLAISEFLARAELDEATLEVWVTEGWLIPDQGSGAFGEGDLARARLIKDLMKDLGVNAEGVDIILHLVDQIHSLRGALHAASRAHEGE